MCTIFKFFVYLHIKKLYYYETFIDIKSPVAIFILH